MDFIITGSRAYGPAREDSDLDIVVKSCDIESMTDYLLDHNIQTYSTSDQESYAGFYFNIAGIKINIIVAEYEADFRLWEHRTDIMKKMSPIEDREKRLATFNSIT